ncbi:MAG: uracil-DNA glycosylase [Acidobacteria bacterium]|nr:uracil-DNA glycosylase [Acidobacteriota bacterium]
MNKTGRVSCMKCRYYQITWDAHMPYGCLAHGFKTQRNPALVVYESSGLECQLFESKSRGAADKNRKPE